MAANMPALVPRPRSGRVAWVGARESNGYGPALGWLGIALGAVEVLAPQKITRSLGLRPSGATTAVVQAMGLREIASGVGILSNPRSKEWLGMRVAGDFVDLALLGAAAFRSERPQNALLAAAAVSAVTALDVLATETLAERRKQRGDSPRRAERPYEPRVERNMTIECEPAEAYAFWRDVANLPRFMRHVQAVEKLDERRSRWRVGQGRIEAEWESEIVEERDGELIRWRTTGASDVEHEGEVRFARAGEGGTVVTVTMQYAPPGGRIGTALLKLMRKEPGQLLADDLRRFKQLLETGEVLVSDATAGPTPRRAQPLPQARAVAADRTAEGTP